MQVLTPGTHGSTFGGNPLAAAVGLEVLDVIRTMTVAGEKILPHTVKMGKIMDKALTELAAEFPMIKETRCRGLWGAIEVRHDVFDGHGGKMLSKEMMHNGVLSKVTRDHTLRLSPPLVITEKQLHEAFDRIRKSCKSVFATAANTSDGVNAASQ
jgi:ornithine--oxo-acid transaminase